MSKRIGNIKLPKKTIQGIKGFEDVFEDYVGSEEYKERERKEFDNYKADEQYELQNFLEQENARLTSLEIFLTKKLSTNKNFSQTEQLILVQIARKKILLEKFYIEFRKPDSMVQKNLAAFFNSHFS